MSERGAGLGVVRRVWAFRGYFALLAALALVVAVLLTSVPRIANRLTEQGLREHLASRPTASRDITYEMQVPLGDPGPEMLEELRREMPEDLRRIIGEQWFTAQTRPTIVAGPDTRQVTADIELTLRVMGGIESAATLVDGRWPAETAPAPGSPFEVALAEEAARELGLRAGSRLWQTKDDKPVRELAVVGLFRPNDAGNGIWDQLPPVLRTIPPKDDGDPYTVVAVGSFVGSKSILAAEPTVYRWRYRVDPQQLEPAKLEPVIDSLVRLTSIAKAGIGVNQGLDVVLREFTDALAAAQSVLAVVSAGVLATLGGLVGLSSVLMAKRRRDEFALLRARGGTMTTIAGRSLTEALLVIPAAVALGWALGLATPGQATSSHWLALLGAVLTTMAIPLAVGTSRFSYTVRREARGPGRMSSRLTVEITVLVLAVLGTFLLYRRGLAAGGVDPLLVSVPVLLAVAAAVLVLRVYPWPLRLVGRLTARGRGTVAFLGFARAGRSTVAAPLIVVIVSVATAAFCGVVGAGVEDGRNRAANLVVPADAMITGDRFAPDTADALAALPGVQAVAGVVAQPSQPIRLADGGASGLSEVYVLIVDMSLFTRVAAEAGVELDLPQALARAAVGDGPVPALVSSEVAAELSGPAMVSPQELRYTFRVAAVADTFPTIGRSATRFVVLPWQALPTTEHRKLAPTGFLVAAPDIDAEALRQVGDEGQRRFAATGLITGQAPIRPSAVTQWSVVRAGLEEGGANGLLFFGFAAGSVGGALFGLLAIAFAVLAGARARGRVLSRLRTMGLSQGQRRGLLMVELAPLVGVSLLTGAAVGTLLPLLLTPVLGLSAFTSGVPLRIGFEPTLVGGIAAFGVLALLVATVLETTINRRMRLGDALRLGEETP